MKVSSRFRRFTFLFSGVMFISIGMNPSDYTPELLSLFMFAIGILQLWLYAGIKEQTP